MRKDPSVHIRRCACRSHELPGTHAFNRGGPPTATLMQCCFTWIWRFRDEKYIWDQSYASTDAAVVVVGRSSKWTNRHWCRHHMGTWWTTTHCDFQVSKMINCLVKALGTKAPFNGGFVCGWLNTDRISVQSLQVSRYEVSPLKIAGLVNLWPSERFLKPPARMDG